MELVNIMTIYIVKGNKVIYPYYWGGKNADSVSHRVNYQTRSLITLDKITNCGLNK